MVNKKLKKMIYEVGFLKSPYALGFIYYAYISLFFSAIFFLSFGISDNKGFLKILYGGSLVVNIVAVIFSMFKKLVIKLPMLTYILISLNMVSLILGLTTMCWVLILDRGQSFSPDSFYTLHSLWYAGLMLTLFTVSIIFHYNVYREFSSEEELTGRKTDTLSFTIDFGGRLFSKNFLFVYGIVMLLPGLISGRLLIGVWWVLAIVLELMLPVHVISPILSIFYLRRHPEARETNY